jgi:hypothetical protein
LNALGETEKDKSSGRHLLGVWKTANTGSKELKRNVKTGLVVFQIPVRIRLMCEYSEDELTVRCVTELA